MKRPYGSKIRILSVLTLLLALLAGLLCAGCTVRYEEAPAPAFRFASAEEGRELLLDHPAYYEEFTPNKLEFVMQEKDASMEEYLEFSKRQVLDFTEEEADRVSRFMQEILDGAAEQGLKLPPLDTIVFIKTTQAEENYSGAYTHGTQIYVGEAVLDPAYGTGLKRVLAHELFHCLTRCDPDFREKMYGIIHFTVRDEDFPLPPSVLEYYIANPDVEHHNSCAVFEIGGKPTECFTALVTTRHYEQPGDNFFFYMTTALVPADGTDTWYMPEDAADFDEVFGTNTGYVIDPEECMADNFSFAMVYGMEGPGGKGYNDPEIIEAIMDSLR